MKPIDKDELYENLRGFLQAKGVTFQQGSYSNGIQKACTLLTDAINLGQKGVGRAKVEIDTKLDQLRQVIHEKTAPRPARSTRPPPVSTAAGTGAGPKAAKKGKSASTNSKRKKRTR